MRIVIGVLIGLVIVAATDLDTAGGGKAEPDAGSARQLGRDMAADRGWTGSQWRCLDQLWERESTWDPNAVNPSSGAYGIPQILPAAHGRPVALGDAKAQIEWGLDYIVGRYGQPCAAWNFWQSRNPHWY